MKSFRQLLEREVLNRYGKIRYYSGFNIDGFFKGYKDGRFNKSAMSRESHVWFYVGDNLISIYPLDGPIHDIGTDSAYFLYFLLNYELRIGRTIKSAGGSTISRIGSISIPNYKPCIFSGLIPIAEIINPGSAPTWYASAGPIVEVDRLLRVEKSGRTIDISDHLMD